MKSTRRQEYSSNTWEFPGHPLVETGWKLFFAQFEGELSLPLFNGTFTKFSFSQSKPRWPDLIQCYLLKGSGGWYWWLENFDIMLHDCLLKAACLANSRARVSDLHRNPIKTNHKLETRQTQGVDEGSCMAEKGWDGGWSEYKCY